ncbi:ShlB/FhaC/HecB family hemolysin secretion/activation protein [Brevifollis gellanilyticus]|uniref:ShlB/FhaC/HecB family hemolysin secretion/activation protein n=1 Tax=Brevifollis gellanilyticus TaxID=748831 RepID=UPI001C3FB33A|nr:ShlB/FhaC/HecB family hemolysin secretion/activation protein [Brevifollis gellanilyticus]
MKLPLPSPNRFPRLLQQLPALAAGLWMTSAGFAQSQEAAASEHAPGMYITEYRVLGAKKLDRRSVEKAVYPFLGPERTPEDVDAARAALEKAYKDAGYSTVSVLIPQQKVKKGVVLLQVSEITVGRLRVHGSRYHDIERLKQKAPSMAEGVVPNFNDVNRDIIALNKHAGLRVTPSLRAGVIPGTVDIDLSVEDELPLKGSLEVNNRYNANTTPWRVSGSLSYSNLWQLGHTIGGSFQIAPERLEDARVYSAYYLAPLTGPWSLLLQGTKQDSDVSTLGGAAVVGRGEIIGLRLRATLPEKDGLYHSISFGLDRKSFEQDLIVAGQAISSPVTYYPLSLDYSATWLEKTHSTDLSASVVLQIPRFGTESEQFNTSRFNANDGFSYFRGDLSHTHDLPGGLEAFAKIQGQLSSGPLINNEQLAGGGLTTVRGYLESTSLGDNGAFATLELRSPSLLKSGDEGKSEWRFHIFADAGYLNIDSPLPEQDANFTLASVGAGTRFRILNHLSGSLDAGLPLIQQGVTDVGELLISVRFMADF